MKVDVYVIKQVYPTKEEIEEFKAEEATKSLIDSDYEGGILEVPSEYVYTKGFVSDLFIRDIVVMYQRDMDRNLKITTSGFGDVVIRNKKGLLNKIIKRNIELNQEFEVEFESEIEEA